MWLNVNYDFIYQLEGRHCPLILSYNCIVFNKSFHGVDFSAVHNFLNKFHISKLCRTNGNKSENFDPLPKTVNDNWHFPLQESKEIKKCHTRLFMRYILPKQPPIRVFLHNTCTVTIDIYKLVVDHIVAATCSPLQWEVTRLRTCACINKHTCKTLCLRKGVGDTMSLFFVCRRSIEDPSFN